MVRRCGCGSFGEPYKHGGYCALRDSRKPYTPGLPSPPSSTFVDSSENESSTNVDNALSRMGETAATVTVGERDTPLTVDDVKVWWGLTYRSGQRTAQEFKNTLADFVNSAAASGVAPNIVADFVWDTGKEYAAHEIGNEQAPRVVRFLGTKFPYEMFIVGENQKYSNEVLESLYEKTCTSFPAQWKNDYELKHVTERFYLLATLVQHENMSAELLKKKIFSDLPEKEKETMCIFFAQNPNVPAEMLQQMWETALPLTARWWRKFNPRSSSLDERRQDRYRGRVAKKLLNM